LGDYRTRNTGDSPPCPRICGIRTDRWKLIYYYGKPPGMAGANPPDTEPHWKLTDLRGDPREMKNLCHDPKYAGLVRKLKAELYRLRREAGDAPA